MKEFQTTVLALVMMLCLAQFVILADDNAQNDNEKTMEEIQREIKEAVSPERIARELGFDYPVKPVTAQIQDIFKKARNEAAQFAKNNSNIDKREAEEAEKLNREFQLYKKGDKVSVVIHSKFRNTVTGRVGDVTKNIIRVGNKWIRTDDLDEETRARFFAAERDALIKKKMSVIKEKLIREEKSLERQQYAKILPMLLKANFYCPINPSPSSFEYLDEDNWVSQKTVFEKKLEDERFNAEQRIYRENGCVFDKDDNTWITQGEFQRRLEIKHKNEVAMREERRKREEALLAEKKQKIKELELENQARQIELNKKKGDELYKQAKFHQQNKNSKDYIKFLYHASKFGNEQAIKELASQHLFAIKSIFDLDSMLEIMMDGKKSQEEKLSSIKKALPDILYDEEVAKILGDIGKIDSNEQAPNRSSRRVNYGKKLEAILWQYVVGTIEDNRF